MDEIVFGLVYGVGFSLLVFLCIHLFLRFAKLHPNRLIKRNFRGEDVPVIGGFPFLVVGALLTIPIWIISVYRMADVDDLWYGSIALLIALFGFGLLGLIDDLFGNRQAGGFRGHLNELLKNRRFSTGLIKATGGGLLALVAGYEIAQSNLNPDFPPLDFHRNCYSTAAFYTPVYGLLIALGANTLNLVDLRPGRSAVLGVIPTFVLIIVSGFQAPGIILLCMILPITVFDRAGKIMLGDCGSNALGAAIGVCYCLALPFWEVCIGVILLAAFNIWCEKHSVNKLIEDTPWLRSIDRKIGVR